MKNYYKILGVKFTATTDEIKKVYRKLCVQFHPDKNPDDKVAEERFKEISEAYEHLSSEEKRKIHDSQLQVEEANRRAAAVRKESSVEIWPIVIGAIAFLAIVIGLVGLLAGPNRKKS